MSASVQNNCVSIAALLLAACATQSVGKPATVPATTAEHTANAVPVREAAVKEPAMKMNYQEFLELAKSIVRGSPTEEIERKLGTAAEATESSWTYTLANLEGFPGLPPAVGTQVFAAVTFDIVDGKVKDSRWAWMDATGPAPKATDK